MLKFKYQLAHLKANRYSSANLSSNFGMAAS